MGYAPYVQAFGLVVVGRGVKCLLLDRTVLSFFLSNPFLFQLTAFIFLVC